MHAEALVKDCLAKHWHAREVFAPPDEELAQYDACFILPYGTKRTVEVKTDFKAEKTGRCFFELRNTYRQSQSGLMATKADIWAHYVPSLGKAWLVCPHALRWYFSRHVGEKLVCGIPYGITLSHPASGDRNSQGILVSIEVMKAWTWADVRDVPWLD